MLQRFAARVARQPRVAGAMSTKEVAKMQVARFADFNAGDEDDEREDPIIMKQRKDYMPRRQTMPEAAKKSRFMVVSPENKGKVRRRILEEFKKDQIEVADPLAHNGYDVPDTGILRDIREMQEEAKHMQFDDNEESEPLNLGKLGLLRQIVHVDKVQKVTTQGNILRFRAMVVVGNMRGCAGYAVGKAASVQEAIDRGTLLAMKRFTYIDRFDDRTLYHEVNGKWNSCTLFLRPAPTGKGLTVSDTVACVLDCFGITDVVSKCHGQRNPYTVIKATFDALSKHQTAEEIALKTGHSLVELSKLARTRNL
ncbi:TPA: hypothetical protein N0F65_001928 [Lagenidium giganteum]|uniref:S5 DRBM domain-containing protein n=1 Tax=Lagenidium giganteum TaxID=4803 RepID=A0AAV2YXC8_9STRA|nr:TPA: hypothetical protein N0F65_001928 [Lagenidium giganteum]